MWCSDKHAPHALQASSVQRAQGRWKVSLIGGDRVGWALDAELNHTRHALDFVDFRSIVRCNVIHVVHWPVLLRIPSLLLVGKRIISHLTHDSEVAIMNPGFHAVTHCVGLWVVRSRKAKKPLESLGLRTQFVPYPLDPTVFHPVPRTDPRVQKLVDQFRIPRGHYLIGSFQRDTIGTDLRSPKLVKGPDIFAEIVKELFLRHRRVHVVLAGPRRFWLRRRLNELQVPFTFIGEDTEDDDLHVNTLTREQVNLLYNLIDV